jgi:hypothetical protein
MVNILSLVAIVDDIALSGRRDRCAVHELERRICMYQRVIPCFDMIVPESTTFLVSCMVSIRIDSKFDQRGLSTEVLSAPP